MRCTLPVHILVVILSSGGYFGKSVCLALLIKIWGYTGNWYKLSLVWTVELPKPLKGLGEPNIEARFELSMFITLLFDNIDELQSFNYLTFESSVLHFQSNQLPLPGVHYWQWS